MGTDSSTGTVSTSAVQIQWAGDLRFDVGRLGGSLVKTDGDGIVAPSPFELLLGAIAACAATDVVTILEKQRTPVRSLTVRVNAERVAQTPRRLSSAVLQFQIQGLGIQQAQAQRAVALSVEKYCSVRSSLDRDIPVTWTVELQPGEG